MEALLIDVDGCLTLNKGEVPDGYYQGLKEVSCFAKRFPTAFCTGRDRNYVEAVAAFLGWPDFWSVIESGIALFNPSTKDLRINPRLTQAGRMVFEDQVKKAVEGILGKHPDLFLYPGNMVCIAIERKHGSEARISDIFKEVKRELKELVDKGFVRISHSDVAIDIAPPDINKASGLDFLAEVSGLCPSRMLGIGDSNGDLSFLEKVGFVGCPFNANKECKNLVQAKQGHISQYPYARGVADVISHFANKGS
jgi:hydroxymethylpyrimidine pyrophosphatase-like HAD family hydrolase